MNSFLPDLVLVKTFALEAERQLQRDDDFGNGLAVSLAQDAVELLLRIVVRERHLTIEPRAGLEKLVAAVDKAAASSQEKVPHAARLEDLNKARVSFKHSGHCPTRGDATKLVRYGFEFLEESFPRFFAMEYRSVSLANQVKNPNVRDALLEAERRVAAEDWQAAVVEAAKAFAHVESSLTSFFPPTSRANVLGDNNPGVVNYLNGLRLVALAGLVGFDPRELMRFRGVAPSVLNGWDGLPPQIVFNGPPQYTGEHAAFCMKFVLDMAVAVQRRLG